MRRFVVIAAGLAVLTAAGCSSSPSGSSSTTPPSTTSSAPASASTTSITVFAAASLQGTFTQLGKQFDAAHPGDTVKFNFGPSSGLATDITNGAPADVFASAAPKNMDTVVAAGDATGPKDFAKNEMEVAVPPSNPAKVTSVTDLAKSSTKVALCQPQVPCGAVAAEVFKNASLTVKPVTLQADVKSVLTQVELGNVDAHGLRDRREGGRLQGQGRSDPSQRQRFDAVPDRYRQQQQEQVAGAGVRGLRAVTRGPEGAQDRGLREALI
jgi:molybdate transport system substrate-binding protein